MLHPRNPLHHLTPFLLLTALVAAAPFPAAAQLQVPGMDTAEVLHGAVTVEVIRGWGIGVGVDVEPADGMVEHLFLLEKIGLIPDELPIELRLARVLATREALVVTHLEGPEVVGLFLRGLDPEEVAEKIAAEARAGGRNWEAADELYTYLGFGFSGRRGSFRPPMSIDWLGGEPSELEGDCQAGGAGSTSCGVTCGDDSCFATCSSGSYSCCNCHLFQNATCTCVPDGGGGSGGGGSGGSGGDCTTTGYCPVVCMRCTNPLF